ncbi:MAG: proline--tRNA ligase [Eubacteriales bacterium]|nr:proline--tRNA ligase [Eubacteriales bacterium]MDD4541323.1 proline--tRNA ligase [Eubacteriales bacterium]
MSKKEKLVKAITSRDEDFSQWYTDIVTQAELSSYSSVRGCMIVRPYATALWELIRDDLDRRFKETGHENVIMPLFIPESLLQKEKDHVDGFAPEVAWVTHGGDEKLSERLCVRPTSEVLFCDHYSEIIESWRDLPKLYNQWVSVVRWEKSTRPFLRTREFFWQEGHTAHATAEEAIKETKDILELYADFFEETLAIPVIKGVKTESEKFAGAETTYTVESMMYDGKALQSGTSHYFGDGFAKVFDIQYTDQENQLRYVHQSSWGVSSRSIGGIIMVHGDDDGLVLPPAVAPIQIAIIPVAQHKEGVLKKAAELYDLLKENYRVKLDDSDRMPGWKFSEYEMKGVPLRLEIGPRDIENNSCVLVTRDNREKIIVPLEELEERIPGILKEYRQRLYDKAKAHRASHSYTAGSSEEFFDLLENKPGFVKGSWCGSANCEAEVKERTGATARCITNDKVTDNDVCMICNEAATSHVIWGKAY